MLQLPEQDHYEIARARALGGLLGRLEPARLAKLGARAAPEGGAVILPTLRWELEVRTDPYEMCVLPGRAEVDEVWEVLALDYLAAQNVVGPGGFVSFADFAEGRGYEQAFDGRVNQRLSHTAGREADGLREAVRRLGGSVAEGDPMRCVLSVFPLLEYQVIRYEADEEFPAACKVLLPDNVLALFSLEDGIVGAEKLVSALEGKSPERQKR